MSQEAKRYKLIESAGKMMLISPTSLAILNNLKDKTEGLEYAHFEKLKPRIPVNSLYVFTERLENRVLSNVLNVLRKLRDVPVLLSPYQKGLLSVQCRSSREVTQ